MASMGEACYADSYLDITFGNAMHNYNMWTGDVIMWDTIKFLRGECKEKKSIEEATPMYCFILLHYSTIELAKR